MRAWAGMVVVAVAVGGVGCAAMSRHGASAPGASSVGVAAAGSAGASDAVGVICGGTAGAPAGGEATVDHYAAVIKANSQCSDREPDARVRADLATQSSGAADACLALDPRAAACQYARAVATGMEARAHPTRAVGLLNGMLQNLNNADSVDPNYDQAGPSRVKALVLIRAPSWPIGPGDTDAGLAAARRAVSLQPNHPPNSLALAEALSKSGDAKGARESYAHARDLAQALPAGPGREGWLRDAEEGLKQK